MRVVRTTAGEVEIDLKGKMEGRGAYLCRNWACWETALKGDQLGHALKVKINRDNTEWLSKAGREILKELIGG